MIIFVKGGEGGSEKKIIHGGAKNTRRRAGRSILREAETLRMNLSTRIFMLFQQNIQNLHGGK